MAVKAAVQGPGLAEKLAAVLEPGELAELAELIGPSAGDAELTALACRDAARAAWKAGRAVGYAQAVREWKVTAHNVGRASVPPSYAELDRRRYPPFGRVGWLAGTLGELYADWAELAE